MPDNALNYASWIPGCLPSCPSYGKLLTASAFPFRVVFSLMCIVALAPMFINVYFVCLLTMLPYGLISLPALSVLCRASRGNSLQTQQCPSRLTPAFIVAACQPALYRSTTANRYFWPMLLAKNALSITGTQSRNLLPSTKVQTAMSSFSRPLAIGRPLYTCLVQILRAPRGAP